MTCSTTSITTRSGSTGIGMIPVRNARVKLMNSGLPSEMLSNPNVPNVEAITCEVACSPATSLSTALSCARNRSSYATRRRSAS